MKRSAIIVSVLLALLIGYVELRVPVSVGAQGGNAVYNTVRTAIPIEPQYLGSGTPAIWNYLRGDGVWAGVSPPTSTSWITSQFSTTSTDYQDTGISVTLDLPAATSDVLLNARIYQANECLGRILHGVTELQSGKNTSTSLGINPLEYTVVHHDPGIGSHTYVFQSKRDSGSLCRINEGSQGISVLIGQVLR